MKVRRFAIMALLAASFFSLQAASVGKRKVYVVKRGDTLGEIVYTLRAEGIDTRNLEEWNPSLGTQVTPGERILYFTPDVAPPPVSQKEMQAETDRIIQEIKARETRPEQFRRIWTYCFFVALTGLGIALFGVFKRRASIGQRVTATAAEQIIPQQTTGESIPQAFRALQEPLLDPDIPTLKEYAAMTGRRTCRIVIPLAEGNVSGIVELRNEKDPLIYFTRTEFCDDARPVEWKKRKIRAAQMLGVAPEKSTQHQRMN